MDSPSAPVSPVVMAALKVLRESSEDDLMNSLSEFKVAHSTRLSAVMAQSVAEGLGAFRQTMEDASYDPELLANALFGDLPEEPGPVRDLPAWGLG